MTTSLFDQDVDHGPDPDERRAVRRAVLGGVLHSHRVSQGWSVNDAASAASIAPMTWRRLEEGLDVRRRSLTALDGLLGLPLGTTSRALDDDLAMVAFASAAGDVFTGMDTTDSAAYLDELAERFRSGTVGSRATVRVTAATRYRSGSLGGLTATAGKPPASDLVLAAELVESIWTRPTITPTLQAAVDAVLAAMPELQR